jgi:hypothetical protein
MNESEKRGYYRGAADRWIEGVRLQVERCNDSPNGESFFDSNFLVVAVARLREVARMAKDRARADLADALSRFDLKHSEFRDVRDFQEHILNPELLGTSMYFGHGDLVRLHPSGRAETLIDPAVLMEDAEELYEAICEALGPPIVPQRGWSIRPPKKGSR